MHFCSTPLMLKKTANVTYSPVHNMYLPLSCQHNSNLFTNSCIWLFSFTESKGDWRWTEKVGGWWKKVESEGRRIDKERKGEHCCGHIFYNKLFIHINTLFNLIAALTPISAYPSYFDLINHTIINHVPRSIHIISVYVTWWRGMSRMSGILILRYKLN